MLQPQRTLALPHMREACDVLAESVEPGRLHHTRGKKLLPACFKTPHILRRQ